MRTNIIIRTKKFRIEVEPCISAIDSLDLCNIISANIAKYEQGFIVIKHSKAEVDTDKDNFRESLFLDDKSRVFVGHDTKNGDMNDIIAKHLNYFRCDANNDYSELTIFFDTSREETRVFSKINRDDDIYRQVIMMTVFNAVHFTTSNIFNIICGTLRGTITILVTKDDFYIKNYQSARYFTDFSTRIFIGDEFCEDDLHHRFKVAFNNFVDDDSSHYGKIEINYDKDIVQDEVIRNFSFPELNAYKEEDK